MWQGHRVSVVFPAYHKEPAIAAAVSDFGGHRGVVEEVLVVDNNSGDHIAAQAEAAGARVVREARQGYSNALHRGLAEAQGEYAVLAEPDGTFMGKDVLKRLAYADGFDLVVGTRTTRDLILARRPNMGCQLRRGNSVDVTVKIKRADGSARRTGRSSSRRDGWLCIQDAATGALRAYLASAHGAPRANPARANPADTRRHCIEQPRLKCGAVQLLRQQPLQPGLLGAFHEGENIADELAPRICCAL